MSPQSLDAALIAGSGAIYAIQINANTVEEARPVINRMLKLFYDEGPWLQLYFQPDFYGVSNRIDWQPRRDEEIELFAATLK